MTSRRKPKKRRRVRTRPSKSPAGVQSRAAEAPAASNVADAAADAAAAAAAESPRGGGFREPPAARPEAAERRRGLFDGLREQARVSPYPPFGVSVARGLLAVGGSPAVLVAAFLSLVGTWGFFAAIGTEPSPKFIVLVMALAPVNVFFDANAVLVASVEASTPATLGLVVALGIIRSLTFAVLLPLLLDAVRGRSPQMRELLRRLPALGGVLWALYAAEVGLVLAVPFLLQGLGGAGLASLAVPLVLVFGLHFLVMAPIIATAEGAGPREALRRSVRAARLPGIRHFALAGGYFAFILWVFAITPGGPTSPVTPSIPTWLIALFSTFIHVGLLGAFAYRWLLVRDRVPAGEKPRAK